MEFSCTNEHNFTIRDYSEIKEAECPDCGEAGSKVIGAPHLSSRMGVDPTSAQGNRWAAMHRKEAKRLNAKIDPNPSS